MGELPNEITFHLELSANSRHRIVNLSVAGIHFDMLLMPEQASAISRRMQRALEGTPFLRYVGDDDTYLLRELSIEGQEIEPLSVRVSAGPAIAHVDGILGRSFYEKASKWEIFPESNVIRITFKQLD